MSNEDLVILIQSGEREKLVELWANIRGMALREAHKWLAYRSGGVELEDLEQAAFIALMRAVDSFDPSAECKFSTLYYPIMRGEFQRAVGRRTAKQAQDPLHQAGSLDVPGGEDEDSATVGELVPDPRAAQAFEDAEEQDRLAHLRAALEEALATLPPELCAAVRGRYYRGVPVDMKAHAVALRLLRAPRCSRALRAFL